MRLPCEMVQDLLPLYHDGVCSGVSEAMIKEHLEGCVNCRQILEEIDAEIAVPELEAEKAQPLVSIHVQWNERKRKMLFRCLAAGVGAFVLLIATWFVTVQWRFVPVEKEDYIVRQAFQYADGTVYLEHGNHYINITPDYTITEDGRLYRTEKRTLLFARWEEDPGGYNGFSIYPGESTWIRNGKRVLITAFYLGKPESEDAILLWREGMELTPASTQQEKDNLESQRKAREAAANGKRD